MRKKPGKNAGIANLKPAWKKGAAPKGGRPKGRKDSAPRSNSPMVKTFREFARGYTDGEEFFHVMKTQTMLGNMKAAELLLHYGQGKPTDHVEITGKDGAPLTMRIIIDD